MSDSEQKTGTNGKNNFTTRIKQLQEGQFQGEHLLLSMVNNKVIFNSYNMDLDTLVNITSTLLHYTGIEFAKYISEKDKVISLKEAIWTITDGAVGAIEEQQLQDVFNEQEDV